MNRETEFRGLRTDGKGWVYGGVVYGKSGKVYIFQGNDDDFIEDDCCEVIPESVGEFTGKHDKNGVKIFEDDKTNPEEEEEKNIVRWDKDNAMFVLDIYGYTYHIGEGSQEVYDNEVSLVDTMSFGDISMEHIEVVGNIHENK